VTSPTVNTTYTVTVDDGVNATTSSVDVSVQKIPVADAGKDTVICHDEVIKLYGTADYYSSILWSTDGDGNFDNPANLDATYTPGTNDISSGEVGLTLTANPVSPCVEASTDDMNLSIEICSGLQEISSNSLNMKILPNPNSGIFDLEVRGVECDNIQLSIVDMKGVSLFSEEYASRNGSLTRNLDLSHLKKGLYMIQLRCEDELVTGKLVIK
jgi:hypothetical protein